MTPSRIEIVVDFADCDPARIVFYPRYFEWFDRATERMFRDCRVRADVLLILAHAPVRADGTPSAQVRQGSSSYSYTFEMR